MSAIDSTATGTSSATTAASKARFAENFDSFLQLLTTQLKSQSPLDPLDTNQFTQQLVQFAGVEQQINANNSLTALVSLMKSSQATTAAGFIGAEVVATGDSASLEEGNATWNFTVPKPAKATITIRNEKGEVVYAEERALVAGPSEYKWDGKANNGSKQPDGAYRISFSAKDTSGQTVEVGTQIKGIVDGVDLSGDTPKLSIGAATFSLDNVKTIRRPAV